MISYRYCLSVARGDYTIIGRTLSVGGTIMNQRELSTTVTSLSITVASCSDKGRVRGHNEDAIALCDPPDQLRAQQLGRLYLLADGAGGHAAGEVASRIAVETISTVYYHQAAPLEPLADPAQLPTSSQSPLNTACIRLQQAFLTAHARIRQIANLKEEWAGMATTCLAAVVQGKRVLIAHVGDSRAYLIRSLGGLLPAVTRLTTDHSLAMELARAGIISREQSYNSPARHVLLRALGG